MSHSSCVELCGTATQFDLESQSQFKTTNNGTSLPQDDSSHLGLWNCSWPSKLQMVRSMMSISKVLSVCPC